MSIYQNKWYQQQIDNVVEEMNEDSEMIAVSPGKSKYIYTWSVRGSGLPGYWRYSLKEGENYLRSLYY